MNKLKSSNPIHGAMIYLVVTALLFATTYIPGIAVLLPVAILAIPFLLVYGIVRYGYQIGGAAAILSFLTYGFFDVQIAGVLAAAILPIAFAAGYTIREKKRFRNSVIISSIAALAGSILCILIIQLVTGLGIVDFTVVYIGKSLETLDDANVAVLYQSARILDVQKGAITQAAVDATSRAEAISIMKKMWAEAFNVSFISMLVNYTLGAGLLCYLIPRAVAKKHKVPVVPIPAFSEFALPKRFWIAYFVSAIFSRIGASSGWPSFDILSITITSVYGFVFGIQALSLLDYFYKMRKMRKGIRITLHILAAILLGNILVWIGVFENALGIRKRIKLRGVVK